MTMDNDQIVRWLRSLKHKATINLVEDAANRQGDIAADTIERLQRELEAEREDAHKWRTYTMHLGVAKAVEAQVKAERERYEARAELERVRGALRLHIPDLEKMAAALWKIRGFEKTADQFDLAAKELRAALGGEG